MTIFDYCFLCLLVLSVLLGCWRGLMSEFLALVGWIVAFFVAKRFAPDMVPLTINWIDAPWLRWVVAYAAIFIAVLLVITVIRVLIRKLLAAAGLSPIDRFLGACFGVLRAVVVAVIVVALCGLTQLPREPWWRNAVFAPPLETVVIAAKPRLPKDLAVRIKYR